MLRQDKRNLLSAALVCLVLLGVVLWMNFTQVGEKLFSIDPAKVEQVVLRKSLGSGGTTVTDPAAVEAVVEHFNSYRYNDRNEYGYGFFEGVYVTFQGEEEFTVEVYPWGVLEQDGNVIYSTNLWYDYFTPLFEAAI